MVAGRHQGGAGQQLDEFTAMSHLPIQIVEFLASGPPASGFGLPAGALLGVAGGSCPATLAAADVLADHSALSFDLPDIVPATFPRHRVLPPRNCAGRHERLWGQEAAYR